MNVTIRQILDAVPAMNKLVTADLPLRTAHRLALLTGKLNPHLDFFQKKQAALEAKGGEGAEEALQALLDYQVELEEERIDISLGEELRRWMSTGCCPLCGLWRGKLNRHEKRILGGIRRPLPYNFP